MVQACITVSTPHAVRFQPHAALGGPIFNRVLLNHGQHCRPLPSKHNCGGTRTDQLAAAVSRPAVPSPEALPRLHSSIRQPNHRVPAGTANSTHTHIVFGQQQQIGPARPPMTVVIHLPESAVAPSFASTNTAYNACDDAPPVAPMVATARCHLVLCQATTSWVLMEGNVSTAARKEACCYAARQQQHSLLQAHILRRGSSGCSMPRSQGWHVL
jgi:hypothetical protein